MTSFQYTKYNAFASGSLEGNPAAVIVLPKPDHAPKLDGVNYDSEADFPYAAYPPASTLQAIATKLNFPMTAFAVPLKAAGDGAHSPDFALRWFNPHHEAPLCGHATVALSNHLFSTLPNPPESLKYWTRLHGIVSASLQQNPLGEGKLVAIQFPEMLDLPSVAKGSQRWEELREMFEVATSSKWTDEGEPLGLYEEEQYLLIEYSPELDMKELQFSPEILAQKLGKFVYMFQISTQASEHIHTRVLNAFADNKHEDIATGSAHRVIVPHALSHPETKARLKQHHDGHTDVLRCIQQSQEGGELVVEWLRETKMVRIMGKCNDGGQHTVEVPSQ
jgi:PhzF family phenazine biosynthesis protein